MSSTHPDGLHPCYGLTSEQITEIEELAAICNQHEGLDLKLNPTILADRNKSQISDFLFYQDEVLISQYVAIHDVASARKLSNRTKGVDVFFHILNHNCRGVPLRSSLPFFECLHIIRLRLRLRWLVPTLLHNRQLHQIAREKTLAISVAWVSSRSSLRDSFGYILPVLSSHLVLLFQSHERASQGSW